MRVLLLTALLTLAAHVAGAATVFDDGFEAEALRSEWSAFTTANGRITTTAEFGPAAGNRHLVLDDAIDDETYSLTQAVLTLDLLNKKNVVLQYRVKSLGDEPHYASSGPGVPHDGVTVSMDGGATWHMVQTLTDIGPDWQLRTVSLDALVAAYFTTFNANFKIRFSQYDNAPAPVDGIAFDDVKVTADDDPRATVQLASPVNEGSGPHVGTVRVPAASEPLTVTLAASPEGQLVLPSSVTIPAGQTTVTFEFSAVGNTAVDLTRMVSVAATAPGLASTTATVAIYDDEAPVPTLTLPAELTEGTYPIDNAALSIDRPANVPLTMTLAGAQAKTELTKPRSVTIPAGATEVVFTVLAFDDNKIDGTVAVPVTAIATGIQSATATTTTHDNEARTLSITPATVQEGTTASATVSVSGVLTTPLPVTISSADPARLAAPETVIIPAGASFTTVAITAAENSNRDGTRHVNISASAADFTSAVGAIAIRDNEVAQYGIGGVGNIVIAAPAAPISVAAFDIEGHRITAPAVTAQIALVLPDGSTRAVQPESITLDQPDGWSGSVALPPDLPSPLRFQVSDASGITALSGFFELMRSVPLRVNDLVWDASRQRFYASVRADEPGPFAQHIVAIDPVSLQVIASVAVSQEASQLSLTSGGEALYATFRSDGRIAKIDAASMTTTSSFLVGNHTSFGAMYASDMFVVPGSPDTIVVSLASINGNTHCGVAAFDGGVARATRTLATNGLQPIEPSAEPETIFALQPSSSAAPLRKLRLAATGVSEIASSSTSGSLFQNDMRSDGDAVVTFAGVLMKGDTMTRAGAFNTTGLVVPEAAASRAYFLQQTYPSSWSYDKIGSYDLATRTPMRILSLPAPIEYAANLIRWQTDGLAFRSPDSLFIMRSRQLVPSEPAADLSVSVQALSGVASVGSPLSYTITVANLGPNLARNAVLTSTFSPEQTLQSVTAVDGTTHQSGASLTWHLGDVPVGSSRVLTASTAPLSAGFVSCNATVTSASIDATSGNNTGVGLVSVQFPSTEGINQLRLPANNLVYDPARQVFWASIPTAVPAPLGGSLVSVDPTTGFISAPVALRRNPKANCMTMSRNGRYLYIGESTEPAVLRIDLQAAPYQIDSILLPRGTQGPALTPADIEVLDGDGTSFIVASTSGDAAIFDSGTRRGAIHEYYNVDRIERTDTPGTFIGYNKTSSGQRLTKLVVTASGLSVTASDWSVLPQYNPNDDIHSSGDLVLTSAGRLVSPASLTVTRSFPAKGRPCLDTPNDRAYLVHGDALRAFEISTGAAAGTLLLPTSAYTDWAQSCLRWGAAGFAILGADKLFITRWLESIPPGADQDRDRIPDIWEAHYFNDLSVTASGDADGDGIANAWEYVYGSSPVARGASPLHTSIETNGTDRFAHLVFTRRDKLATTHIPLPYVYEISSDLKTWSLAHDVSETVLGIGMGAETAIETIDARVRLPQGASGFVRLRWLGE